MEGAHRSTTLRFVVAGIILGAIVALFNNGQTETVSAKEQLMDSMQISRIRQKVEAPDFALQDLRGEIVRLSDYRGSVVLLNFWTTW